MEKKETRGGARAGAGRKIADKEKKVYKFSYRITEEEREETNKLLKEIKGKSIANKILQALREFKK